MNNVVIHNHGTIYLGGPQQPPPPQPSVQVEPPPPQQPAERKRDRKRTWKEGNKNNKKQGKATRPRINRWCDEDEDVPLPTAQTICSSRESSPSMGRLSGRYRHPTLPASPTSLNICHWTTFEATFNNIYFIRCVTRGIFNIYREKHLTYIIYNY